MDPGSWVEDDGSDHDLDDTPQQEQVESAASLEPEPELFRTQPSSEPVENVHHRDHHDMLFLVLVRQWLIHDPMPPEETTRAAVVIQSMIQSALENKQALELTLEVCAALHIDGAECIRWCESRNRQARTSLGQTDTCETFVLDLKFMKLPPFIDVLCRVEGPSSFIYAYHNGHQSFAANDLWNDNFISPNSVRRSAGTTWTFIDCIALMVVEQCDREDFLAVGADLLIKGRSPREERSCVVSTRNKYESEGNHRPCLVTLRLWSDTGTQSYIFAMQIVRLPMSSYFHQRGGVRRTLRDLNQQLLEQQEPERLGHDEQLLSNPLKPQSEVLVENTQRLIEKKKWLSRGFSTERELLTEEQLIAAMLPLDEVLELDELDVEAVAEYLHG